MQSPPQSVVPIDTTAAGPSVHRFVINLTVIKGQGARIRSCEVIAQHHRNRFTFPVHSSLGDVFVAEVARGLADCLASVSKSSEVLSLPNVAIEIPGLTLARAHLMASKTTDGSLSVILRFKMVLGAITRAFRPELGIDASVEDHSATMSALVLTDIVMPLLDLCAMAEHGGLAQSDRLDAFLGTLIERSEDVRFQAELIKRFVATSGTGPSDWGPPAVTTKSPLKVVR